VNIIDQKLLVVRDRFRRRFDEEKIRSLADSIAEVGLVNLPVCRQLPDGTIELVAGERRTRAIKLLHDENREVRYHGQLIERNMIPFALLSDLPEHIARQIELDENIQRVDLTWQEVAQATALLHKLRTAQDPTWSVRRTAEEIAEKRNETVRPTIVQARLQLAEHLDNPEVAAASTEREAVKALYRVMERDFLKAAGSSLGPVVETGGHQLQLIDAVEGTRTLHDGSIHLVCTDPPYGMDAQDHVEAGPHPYNDKWEYIRGIFVSLFPELVRVMAPKSHLYLFTTFEHTHEVMEMLRDVGLDVWPRPLIWVRNTQHAVVPYLGPLYQYECIIFANKGKRPVNVQQSDVLNYNAVSVSEKRHKAEKPVPLIENLLRRSINPGGVVLDPFCGSGPIFEAATNVSCTAIGFDTDPSAIELSRERIARKGNG
jgi:DNA modification methylase